MFYLLHGNDEFTCREHLKKLRKQGDYGYNSDTYVGGETPLATLIATCDTFPFLTDARLVVLEGLPKKRKGEETSAGTAETGGTKEAPADNTKKCQKRSKNATESRDGFAKGWVEYSVRLPPT